MGRVLSLNSTLVHAKEWGEIQEQPYGLDVYKRQILPSFTPVPWTENLHTLSPEKSSTAPGWV